MSSTNHTTNYNLPQFVGTDKPAWLGDINPALSAIDTAMHANSVAAAQAGTDAGNAQTRADNAYTKAGDAELAAGTAQETANNAVSGLSTANTRIDGLYSKLNLNQISNASLSIITTNDTALTLAQSQDGSVFKLYGQFTNNNNSNTAASSTMAKSAVPGLTNKYGFDTGLVLNSAPDEAYVIAPAGICIGGTRGYSKTSTDYMDAGNFFNCQIAVGTNGHIYVSPFNTWGSNSADSIRAYTRSRVYWLPCVYFNGNFGDNPQD